MQPGKKLRALVRAGFVAQESTLAEFCRAIEVDPSNASKALVGEHWDGEEAAKLRQQLVAGANFNGLQAALKSVIPETGEQA
jgi:hypothetical protein